MQKTPIEYLTHTWNPIAILCTRMSAGCDHCWHLRTAHRMESNPIICKRRRDAYAGGAPWLDRHEMSAPLRRKKPAMIGVQFMGDLFHERITNEQIAAIFGVIAATPHHQYVILTKRPERAVAWYKWMGVNPLWKMCRKYNGTWLPQSLESWPPPNLTVGVSVEGQEIYLDRLEWLVKIPAHRKIISYEPALKKIDFALMGTVPKSSCNQYSAVQDHVDGIIMGAETGPGARPMEINWARYARDQCQADGVPFFFKRDSNGNREIDGVMHEEVPW